MELFDKDYKLLQKIALGAITKITGMKKTQEMNQDLREASHPIGVAIIAAQNRALDKLNYSRNREIAETMITGVTWKALHSINYEYLFAEFLHELKHELNKLDLDPYRKPPKEWPINKGSAVAAAREKSRREKRDE